MKFTIILIDNSDNDHIVARFKTKSEAFLCAEYLKSLCKTEGYYYQVSYKENNCIKRKTI